MVNDAAKRIFIANFTCLFYTCGMKAKASDGKAVKTWRKTPIPNLLRHKSGLYYARITRDGKQIWQALKTANFKVAESKLADFKKTQREHNANSAALLRGKMTFADALAVHLEKLANDVQAKRTKPSTVHYWKQVFRALLKNWPDLPERDVRRIAVYECKQWAQGFSVIASPTRYNNTIAGLRHVLEVAKEAALIYSNPAEKLERVPVRQKQLVLPSAAQFEKVVNAIRSAGAWCSRDVADFVEGLAFTGMRKGEANEIEWHDLDFEGGEIIVRGDAETATKNWSVHRLPMTPDARELFSRMRSERADESESEKVFRVREAQKALANACKKVGTPRITHHDLRHLFATTAIESGVDIPTVSRWLNHKDGGALAMRTYGHLRREHSAAAALKVSFRRAATQKLAA
ncbi:MAG: hypothetical protein DLM73_01050 [Chthoniobacterales bacterium]|nr:MAG: hypothetical protein DLM73_01050 [Chthoniobacterales bacterium]